MARKSPCPSPRPSRRPIPENTVHGTALYAPGGTPKEGEIDGQSPGRIVHEGSFGPCFARKTPRGSIESVLSPNGVLDDPGDTAERQPGYELVEEIGRQLLLAGTAPAVIADRVFDAIREERFYVLPHPEWKDFIQTRMEDVLGERNPVPPDMAALLARLQAKRDA